VFIVAAEQYFEFDLFTNSQKKNLVVAAEHIVESGLGSFKVCFRFIQAIERFEDITTVKFVNALYFDLINLTSCLKMLKHSTIMSATDQLRSKGSTPHYFWSCL
jgi:hypothetical protein|tara:strand:- start:47 stop:358 length:312 start_codon:yes stop_codon:yes gene_type:complete